MATVFENVHLATLTENGELRSHKASPVRVELCSEKHSASINILNGTQVSETLSICSALHTAPVGRQGMVLSCQGNSFLLKFPAIKDFQLFQSKLKEVSEVQKPSVFTDRTEEASAEQYFQFYGYLSQQQNMMQDYVRTSTYQRAMLNNTVDFQDKVVLDVGAGSGILSFFAIQAGAKKVYAIEASSMALHCAKLVEENDLQDRIIVTAGKIEEVDVPEPVDMIISEPMGYMLFNERMLETFLHAKKWLKPGGKMFPTQGDLHIAPFSDDALFMEQFSKANFWYQPSFHGVDLTSLREDAVKEYFKQPIVDTFDIRICLARSQKYTVDFQTAAETDLHEIDIPVSFVMQQAGTVHGLAFWFDVAFLGSQSTVWLSTSPTQPLTHWYQVRCLVENPIFVRQGQTLMGRVVLRSNKRQSYDVDIELYLPGTNTKSSNTLDLKNPFFRYTGQQPVAPPGTEEASPSDAYWNQDATESGLTVMVDGATGQVFDSGVGHVQANSYGLLNGGMGDGHVVHQQTGVVQTNLVPLANMAPVNPGSIPAATIVTPHSAAQHARQNRTSVGGGMSPTLVTQVSGLMISQAGGVSSSGGAIQYPISNQFMIGDYAVPGSMVLPTQGLNLK